MNTMTKERLRIAGISISCILVVVITNLMHLLPDLLIATVMIFALTFITGPKAGSRRNFLLAVVYVLIYAGLFQFANFYYPYIYPYIYPIFVVVWAIKEYRQIGK